MNEEAIDGDWAASAIGKKNSSSSSNGPVIFNMKVGLVSTPRDFFLYFTS